MALEPLVSVVIPAYNSEAYISATIESVLRQDYRNVEVLVADDGSKDGTRQAVEKFGAPVRYLRQENRGPAGARNLALRYAGGKYVAFLDADDLWHPRKLAIQVDALEKNENVGICGTRIKEFDDGREVSWEPLEEFPARPMPRETFKVRNRYTTSSVVARRDAVLQAGGFDEAIFGSEDWDMWRRITQEWRAIYLRQTLVAYRMHPKSISRNAPRMLENNRKVLRKTFAANADMPWHMKLRAWSYLHVLAAREYGNAQPFQAARELAVSALYWPLPMGRTFCVPFARTRCLGGLVLDRVRGRAEPAQSQ